LERRGPRHVAPRRPFNPNLRPETGAPVLHSRGFAFAEQQGPRHVLLLSNGPPQTGTLGRETEPRFSWWSRGFRLRYMPAVMIPWRNSVPRKALAPAAFIDPCLPSRAERAPAADGWVHEIKHDGFRLQIHARGSRVGLYTMTGVDWTERYPWIVEDVARLNVRHAIIDTECCCDGEGGITDFERLMARVCVSLRLCVRSTGNRRHRHAPRAARRSQGRARQAAAQSQARHPLQRTHQRRRTKHLRARLPHGPRGHRVETHQRAVPKRQG